MTPQIKACVVQAWWIELDPWDQTQGTTHSTKSSPDHHVDCDLPLPNILLSNNHYNFERNANSWVLLVFLKKPWTWLIKILSVCVYICVHVHVCAGACTCCVLACEGHRVTLNQSLSLTCNSRSWVGWLSSKPQGSTYLCLLMWCWQNKHVPPYGALESVSKHQKGMFFQNSHKFH